MRTRLIQGYLPNYSIIQNYTTFYDLDRNIHKKVHTICDIKKNEKENISNTNYLKTVVFAITDNESEQVVSITKVVYDYNYSY